MSIKTEFINYIEENVKFETASDNVKNFWKAFCSETGSDVEKPLFTDNGKLILNYMIEHQVDMPLATAKAMGEGLGVSSRTISGGIRKLVTDGYVEKVSESPVVYSLTEKGKNTNIVD